MSTPACRLRVKAVPGASRSEVSGMLGAAVKIRVAAPPEGGRANQEVLALVAGKLGLPSAQVTLVAGHSSPAKVLAVHGLDEAEARRRLLG